MVQQQPKVKTQRVKTKHSEKRQPIHLLPKNDKQKEYLEALKSSDQVIVFGPAGTGKTYCVATFAANQYHLNNVNKIVITRPHVAVGRDIGFLKGDLNEKTMPWALPVLDVLERHLTKGVVETALRNGNIEIAPLALMRGRSFENAFVIVDETQNITLQEVKMLVTRIGEGSKLVLNGDIQQSDLAETDGLTRLVHYAKKYMLPIPIVEFGIDDVVRSDICKQWIKVFTEEGV